MIQKAAYDAVLLSYKKRSTKIHILEVLIRPKILLTDFVAQKALEDKQSNIRLS
jgi:hypothetical protein